MGSASPLLAALMQPGAYGLSVRGPIEVVQTHISMLFFVDDLVYKVKKPVDMGFLDYTTLEARQRFCAAEVRLNRRLAPATYLGVEPVTRDPQGAIHVAGEGEVIDYAVKMRRLPAERMLDRMLQRGEIDNALLDDLAALLADFHERCPTGPGVEEFAAPDELRRQVIETMDKLSPGGPVVSRIIHEHLRRWLLRFVDEHHDSLLRRQADGRIREGHGDLHAGNICLTEAGIVIYDCIEFTRRFRCRDVACELAFLAMDIDHRGFPAFAAYLLKRYAVESGDDGMAEVADFYKVYLAVVRGMVASLKADDADVTTSERDGAVAEARQYLNLAACSTLGPALIVMCGLPGSGKSSAARAIARPFGAAIHRSDVIRKELAGVRPDDHMHSEIYSGDMSERTYRTMLERCAADVRAGRTTIADATFVKAAHREPFLAAARQLGVPGLFVWTRADEETIRRRLARRAGEAGEVSDADWLVYQKLKAEFEPPGASWCITVEQETSGETLGALVIERLIDIAYKDRADGVFRRAPTP